MASSNQTKSLTLLFLILTVSSFILTSSSSSTDQNKKVKLALYYESLCPYSANFIVNYLAKLIENDELFSIVDLYLSPWGNAKFKSNDTFVCQHGAAECLLNTVEACAIHVWPSLEDHFPFINCVESLVLDRKFPEWETCFETLGLEAKAIADCYTSGLGKELELQYGAETNALQPPHQYVPWVVVNGQPLYEDYENFVSYICEAYKSSTAPKACSEVSHHTSLRSKTKNIAPVTFKDGKMSTLSGRIVSVLLSWMKRMNGIASV